MFKLGKSNGKGKCGICYKGIPKGKNVVRANLGSGKYYKIYGVSCFIDKYGSIAEALTFIMNHGLDSNLSFEESQELVSLELNAKDRWVNNSDWKYVLDTMDEDERERYDELIKKQSEKG